MCDNNIHLFIIMENQVLPKDIGKNIYTPLSVTKEITSKSQLRRLAVLPYDLTVKEPLQEDIKYVTEFAKKTGDYASLSATDIQVIALTYQLERENVGVDHLRTEPIKSVINPARQLSQEFKHVAGFYVPTHPEKGKESPENLDTATLADGHTSIEEIGSVANNLHSITIQDPNIEESSISETDKDSWFEANEGENNDEAADNDDGDKNCEISDADDDDDEGWITPSNLQIMKQKIISGVEEEEEVKPVVACLTTDFAMQNVLKQIGLAVIALDGRVIKQLRTFILRCHACFKTTSVMNKVFCPKCGNKTLKKVAVTTNPDGTQQIHINFRRPLTARGKRFSLPKFQGGKHANNPILCEDQPLPQQRASRLSRAKTNALDDDYTAGFSPFVARDVTSRSALLGIRPNEQVKQWMRRNPNESTKPGGRKRK